MPFAVYVILSSQPTQWGEEKQMQNLETERKPEVFFSRERTCCTPSGEVYGLCAVFQTLTYTWGRSSDMLCNPDLPYPYQMRSKQPDGRCLLPVRCAYIREYGA